MRTAETEIHADPGMTIPETVVKRAWPHARQPYAPPGGLADHRAYAEVNRGRWIVHCPFCPGAQLASEGDPRFFCVDCLHEGTGAEGQWLPVAWPAPDLRAQIEETLHRRPLVNRNWSRTELVSDLEEETRAHLAGEDRWLGELETRRAGREQS